MDIAAHDPLYRTYVIDERHRQLQRQAAADRLRRRLTARAR